MLAPVAPGWTPAFGTFSKIVSGQPLPFVCSNAPQTLRDGDDFGNDTFFSVVRLGS